MTWFDGMNGIIRKARIGSQGKEQQWGWEKVLAGRTKVNAHRWHSGTGAFAVSIALPRHDRRINAPWGGCSGHAKICGTNPQRRIRHGSHFFIHANQSTIDLWIDGRGGATPLLKSPNDYVPSTGWRRTRFVETSATRFDDVVVVPDAAAFRSTPGLPIVSGKVYLAITQDGNYAKFRVEPPGVQVDQANNKRFVNITVAYNSGGGNWAKPVIVDRQR